MRKVGIALIALAAGASLSAQPPPKPPSSDAPKVVVLKPQDFWGEYAIWGASGAMRSGRIYFGMTSNDSRGSGSAHLFELNPGTGIFVDRGDVVAELERLHLRRPGETQMKIHSRIVEAADGFQYFASMDETGEKDDGSKLPTWGGHLWRRGPSGAWEHLAATPEALIAVALGGPYVYSLGYFNHVLYQFDTRTKRLRSVTVGSAGGHVSRNFFADQRGHVFVPRTAQAGRTATAHLVEFDETLKEIGSAALPDYFESEPDSSHGIVAAVPDGAGGWYFTTGKGRLYREQPRPGASFALLDLGWMHPAGSRYPAALFRDATADTLYSVSFENHNGATQFEWLTRSTAGVTSVVPLPYGDAPSFPAGAVLYGSMTTDLSGRVYVVGMMANKPVILQITPNKAAS